MDKSEQLECEHELKVLKKSRRLCSLIYKFTNKLPASEEYGLKSQMRRAVISIASNIAEGNIARGSAYELQTQIKIANDVYNIQNNQLINNIDEIMRMLYGLKLKLQRGAD